ncbi:flagellar motor switch protein FliN [Sphingomonas koreensis]|uniref:Flagellar motor switch protein FliN n=1 Tax=Sphingomonas koreensis TaxID=93064 RepID=A0A1L6JG65_9SPHN|nr:FliM/FliN family flagellar motor switch protein [Sphingomonas koreensis]APR54926.1 flagellar motor switch protein FliN [Sphingomonas koreensis]MDC7812926.1 FliM/FliN family flagellar motor switch protein [Sphingomonas koreensis]PJI87863.1 flagellar motor switch protein FliN/FliY [Sphingomonas koreensis]RSU18370.1 flagellar motor switch protein FliN [Sphingomonas koreensis]RSU28665.1 flagellar motor switch protein FliN [Sphingomonas koreensis]
MSVLEGIPIDLSIVLGSTDLPIRQVLKMSRGAMIPLDSGHNDPTRVYVNNELVAEGKILVDGEYMSLEITRVIQRTT